MGTLGNDNHALVFGASGITGWAITNCILNGYPTSSTFSKVTALTNRPLPPEVAQWPKSDKLQVVSGLDILAGDQSALEATIKAKVDDISTITHVYFFAYIMDTDPEKEISINVSLLKRAVSAIENLSTKLKSVVLPTGTKAYGIHLIEKFPYKDRLPLAENLPRIPEPYASQMFYYNQVDLLKEMSKGKSWTFFEIIPDNIVGFVPNNNIYCLAQALGLYLSLYREIEGQGAEVVFPGTMESWAAKINDSSQDIVAKFAIYASLHPEASAGESINAADNAVHTSWSVKWPIICDYFGLKGVAPSKGSGPDPVQYTNDHRDTWLKMEQNYGLQTGRVGNDRSYGGFPYFVMTMFNFDRHLDMTKMHRVWGSAKEETDVKGAWWTAFDRFRKAKIIP